MARTTASRKYQLTINNPVEHGSTHEVIKSTFSDFSGLVYWCMCDEVGAEGTYHTHVYMAFKNAVEFTAVKRRFYEAHIEAAHGSHRENRDYIRKEGKWAEDVKHETNLPDTFEESGELPEEQDKRRNQSEEVLAMLEAGADNVEIIRAFPTQMNHLRNIDATRQALLESKYRTSFRELTVHYLWGQTGAGKTRSVMDAHGYENVYQVTNYAHPFDGYRGQPVMLFDEFRSSLTVADMLKYLDGYPLMLPCRYSDKVACYTTVYIVSNIPLERQYPNVQLEEPETWKAFLRRIHEVTELLPDDTEIPF